jgi:hypothetical protein
MDINFEYASITGKNFSLFGRHLAEIFKFLIAKLFMGHPVYTGALLHKIEGRKKLATCFIFEG